MPSTISGALEAHLAGEVVTLAILTKITRLDGVVVGITSHDQDLTFGGLTYKASDAVSSSAVSSKIGTGIDNQDIEGILNSSQFVESDVAAGIYQGAKVEVRLVNWADLTMNEKVLLVGQIGEITLADGKFNAEVRSLSQLLAQPVGEQTVKTCPVRLGDARCKVNMSGNTVGGTPIRATKTVASSTSTTITFGSDSAPTGHYSFGVLKFNTGLNAGISRPIKTHTNSGGSAVITPRVAFPFAVANGDQAQLEAGCDGLWATCGSKFANKNNFHGQPFIPGNDKIQRVGR